MAATAARADTFVQTYGSPSGGGPYTGTYGAGARIDNANVYAAPAEPASMP